MKTEQITIENGTAIVNDTFNKLNDQFNTNDIYLSVFDLYHPNSLGESNILSRQITISPNLFNPAVGTGYKKERKIQEKHNLSHEDFIKWTVCHEFAHVYYFTTEHTNDFFRKVEMMYKQIQ